jgi:hypothetical protein
VIGVDEWRMGLGNWRMEKLVINRRWSDGKG